MRKTNTLTLLERTILLAIVVGVIALAATLVSLLHLISNADEQATPTPTPIEKANYEVHEWGVLAGCEESDSWLVTSRPEKIMLVKQPVIYIYSKNVSDFNLKVKFLKGYAEMSYPEAENRETSLEWNNVKVMKNTLGGAIYKSSEQRVPLGEIADELSTTDANILSYKGVNSKFLYYEGAIPFENKVKVKIDRETKEVIIKNNFNFPVQHVTVAVSFKSNAPPYTKKYYYAYIYKLDSGAETILKLKEQKPKLEELAMKLGLYKNEAKAFANIWEQNFFKFEYSAKARVSYALPQSEIEKLIELEFQPKPKKILRVLFVLADISEEESKTKIVKSCTNNNECAWKSTNCCPENAGASWQCINIKLSKIECPSTPVCLQVINPKPEKKCICLNGICTEQ